MNNKDAEIATLKSSFKLVEEEMEVIKFEVNTMKNLKIQDDKTIQKLHVLGKGKDQEITTQKDQIQEQATRINEKDAEIKQLKDSSNVE